MNRPRTLVHVLVLGSWSTRVVLADPARPSTLTLDWQAPQECPSAADVRSEIERLLGGPPQLPPGKPLSVHAVVRNDGVWRVSLGTTAGTKARKRELDADSCRGAAEATALIVALMVDPNAVAQPLPAPVASPASSGRLSGPTGGPSSSPSAIGGPDTEPPRAAGTDSGPTSFTVASLMSVSMGTLPQPDIAAGVSIGIRHGLLSFALAGYYGLIERTAYASSLQGAGGRFRFGSASLIGCHALVHGPLDAGPCAFVDVGGMGAQGFGVSREQQRTAVWLAAGAAGFVKWNVGRRVALLLELGALAPFFRPSFVLDNVGHVFRTAPVSGRANLGMELRF
jgi:hypothetical protein